MKNNSFALTVFLLCIQGFVYAAAPISLNFDTLPSAQGWQYFSNGISEADAFSVDGTILRQNASINEDAYYKLSIEQDFTQGFSVEIHARVVNYDPIFDRIGFQFELADGYQPLVLSLFLSDSYLNWHYTYQQGIVKSVTFDNTSFHDYRFDVSKSGSLSFFIDNNLIDTGIVNTNSFIPKSIYLGDITAGNRTSQAEIAGFKLRPVPLASGIGFFMAGLSLILGAFRFPTFKWKINA